MHSSNQHRPCKSSPYILPPYISVHARQSGGCVCFRHALAPSPTGTSPILLSPMTQHCLTATCGDFSWAGFEELDLLWRSSLSLQTKRSLKTPHAVSYTHLGDYSCSHTAVVEWCNKFLQGREFTKYLARPGPARVAASHENVRQLESTLRANRVSKLQNFLKC